MKHGLSTENYVSSNNDISIVLPIDITLDKLLVLLVLNNHKNGRIFGRKRFQKIMYMLKEKYEIPVPFSFSLYLYGPYSIELQNTIDDLVLEGLIKEEYIPRGEGKGVYMYQITDKGRKLLGFILQTSANAVTVNEMLKKHLKELEAKPTDEIVKLAYETFKQGGSRNEQ